MASRRLKVVLVGDGGVGKTNLIFNLCTGSTYSQYHPTVFENFVADIEFDKMKIELAIWDTGGIDTYSELRPLSYPDTDGIMVVFDITNIGSFKAVANKWLPEIDSHIAHTVKLLVGTKFDLMSDRQVTYKEAQMFANENGMMYIETSAKTDYNVDEAFKLISRNIVCKESDESKRKKLLQKSIDKAKKKHGTIPVRFLKLFFTGSGAAGKTSFINLLMKKKFVEHHHSTNVVQTSHAVSVKLATFHGSSDDKVEWIDLTSNLEVDYLRSVLLPKEEILQTVSSLTSPSKHEDPLDDINSKDANQYTAPVRKSSIKQWLTTQLAGSVKGSSLSTFDSILSTYSNRFAHHAGKMLNIITLLDTGGQPEYIHLLPTINIYPTVTFVIHDLSKSLSDQVLVEYSQHGKHMFTPYHLSYSNLDMIKLLMSAANDSVERPAANISKLITTPGSNEKSYICLVGTHVDKVSGQKVNEVENELNALVNMTHCEAAVWQNKNETVLFSVNNVTAGQAVEDPVAEIVRKKIELLAEEKEVYNLPITWMILQLEIRENCSKTGKAYISFQDCVALARDTGLMSKEKEVKSVLHYHHLLGVLIYFDEVPGLCDYVIVDHQWWFDKLSNIISITFQQASLDHHAVQKLKYQGLLSKELLQHVEWKDDIKEEVFLSLLVHMRIIASMVKQKNKEEEYFIPYILPTYNLQKSNEILDQYGHLQGEPLLVQFRSGFLPRGLFCCLIVELLQHPPIGWEPRICYEKTHYTFSNVITFVLPNSYFLSLLDKVSYLELQIRSLKEVVSKVPIHVDAYNYLVYALTEVCNHLTFDYERLQYGFLCNCGKKPDHHIAITRLPIVSSEAPYAKCTIDNAHKFKMNPSQKIWFYLEQKLSDGDLSKSSLSSVYVNEDSLAKNKDQSKSSSPTADVIVDSLADNTDQSASLLPSGDGKVDSLAKERSDQPVLKRPAMKLLHEVVIPRIAADWSIVADYLEYEVEYKRIIKERCQNDPVKCCVELLEDWLSSNRGVSPKSWSRLIEALRGIRSLTATTEKIINDLEKAGVFV